MEENRSNMFGRLENFAGLVKSAKEMQERLATVQRELLTRRHQGDAGGGAVVATVDGRGTLVKIKIQPDAVGDVEFLEDLIKAAVVAATAKAHESVRTEVSQLTGGLNLPGLTDFFGGLPA